jgi:mRNA interferase YafQ
VLEIIETKKFEKDMEIAKRRGKSMSKIRAVVNTLAKEEPLPEKHRPHRLLGNWNSFHECHIEPDWLLIYKIEEGTLVLARTGTHSDLF